VSWTDTPGRHPVSVLMVFAALVLFGAVSFFSLKLEELPEITVPEIRIVTEFPGFPPAEMEQLITLPLENSLSGVKDVREIESVSKPGISSVTLRFDWAVNLEMAALEVRENIDSVYPFLPRGAEKPVVFTDALSDRPAVTLAVLPAAGGSVEDLYIPVKYDLKGRLQKLDEVAVAEVLGLRKPEITVDLDMDALYVQKATASGIARQAGRFLVDDPAGRIREGTSEQLVEITTGIRTPAQIGELPVLPGSGMKLKELARIEYGIREPTSLYLFNGAPAVGIRIYKSGGAGTLNAARAVRQALPLLEEAFRGSLEIRIVDDASGEITRAVFSLLISLVLGLAAAVLVLFAVYRGLRLPLITSLSIPLTMVIVFFLMYLLDISLNTVSLLGMVIGIGLIADNSIIILEELQSRPDLPARSLGEPVRRISPAVFSSSLTTVLVFLPPLFIPGLTGVLFRDLILTIMLLILVSFPVSHLFSPACFALTMNRRRPRGVEKAGWIAAAERFYKRLLLAGLKRRGAVVLLYILVLAAGGGLLLLSAPELFPARSSFQAAASVSLPADTPLERAQEEAAVLTAALREQFGFPVVYVESGFEPDSLRDKSEAGRFFNHLQVHFLSDLPVDREMVRRVEAALASLGWEDPVVEPRRSSFESLLQGESRRVISFSGSDRALLEREAARSLDGAVREGLIPGYTDRTGRDQRVLRFSPDRDSLSAAGLTASDLQSEMTAVIHGTVAGEVPFDREKIAVRIRAREEFRDGPEALAGMLLPAGEGRIALGEVGRFSSRREYEELRRRDRQCLKTAALTEEADLPLLLETLRRGLPAGTEVAGPEDFVSEKRAFLRLFLFALVLMFLVLGAQTGSAGRALLLFSSLPVSLTGSLLMLVLTRQTLNLYSFIGILILQGTIVNTAILLISNLRSGSAAEVLHRAGGRVRPVLSTTLTTVAALFPVLWQALREQTGTGGMAAAVIGGMVFGTPLVMLFIPVFRHGR